MKDVRLLLGFVLAPAVVPAASVLCAWGFVRHYTGAAADVDSMAPFVRYSFRIELPAAYFLMVLCATPYVLSLRERGVLNFWTPAFILLDYTWGINVRVAVLDEMPLYKNLYYGLCILCGVMVYFRPRSAALVALAESSIILLLTLVGVFWPYVQIATLPEGEFDAALAGFTIQRVVNLLLAGFIAVVGIYTSKDAVVRACGLGKSESERAGSGQDRDA